MFVITQDTEDIIRNANVVKEVVLLALEREGLLLKPAAEIGPLYAVVLHKKGWFGQMWDKWFNATEKDTFKVVMVKIVQ